VALFGARVRHRVTQNTATTHQSGAQSFLQPSSPSHPSLSPPSVTFSCTTIMPSTSETQACLSVARLASYHDVVMLDKKDSDHLPSYRMGRLMRNHPYTRWSGHHRFHCIKVSMLAYFSCHRTLTTLRDSLLRASMK
jgi:hypothetical protein